MIYDLYSTSCLHLYGWRCNFLGGASSLESLLECILMIYDLYRIPDYTFTVDDVIYRGALPPWSSVLECVLPAYDDSHRLNRRIWNTYIQTCSFLFQILRFSPFESFGFEKHIELYDLYSNSYLHLYGWPCNFPGGTSPLELSLGMYFLDLWFI